MNIEFERLEDIATTYFGGFKGLAKKMNKKRTSFYFYQNSRFGNKFLQDLEDFGINPEYIRKGQPPMFLNTVNLDNEAREKYLLLRNKDMKVSEPNPEYSLLNKEDTKKLINRLIKIPLYREIAYANTGTIIPDIQQFQVGETIEKNPVLGGDPEQIGAVEVSGNSMKDFGIITNSRVIFNKAIVPRHKDVVVVIINGHLMVKQLIINKNGEYEFHSGDGGFTPPIVGCPDDICKIIGVVTDTIIKF